MKPLSGKTQEIWAYMKSRPGQEVTNKHLQDATGLSSSGVSNAADTIMKHDPKLRRVVLGTYMYGALPRVRSESAPSPAPKLGLTVGALVEIIGQGQHGSIGRDASDILYNISPL